jgi:hypothetical protein
MKFNWNRFYDELESADPQKFPFWMFMISEISGIVGSLAVAFFTAIFITFSFWILFTPISKALFLNHTSLTEICSIANQVNNLK